MIAIWELISKNLRIKSLNHLHHKRILDKIKYNTLIKEDKVGLKT